MEVRWAAVMSRLYAAALVGSLIVLGGTVVRIQERTPRFERGECPIAMPSTVRIECGHLIVSERRERPEGQIVRLPVAIFRGAKTPGTPPLVMLHGGPGGNGLRSQFPPQAAAWAITLARDVIVYDQRGSGLSQPALCPEVIAKAGSRSLSEIAGACLASLKAGGIDPGSYSTEANAADATDLRRILGYTAWDVYGVSYGGRVALELMRRDRTGTRAVILASALPVGPQFQAQDALTSQRALERIFARCAAHTDCAAAFPTLEADFYAVYNELTARPIPVQVDPQKAVVLNGPRFVSGIQQQLANAALVPRIPLLIHELRRGDRARAARALALSSPIRLNPTMMLVNAFDVCGVDLRAAAAAANRQAHPAFRASVLEGCELWQTRAADAATQRPVESDIPTLILTAEFDDRDPTDYGRAIASTLTTSYLFEAPGRVHGPLFGPCQDRIVLAFLTSPMQRPDASCLADDAIAFETRSLDKQRFVFEIAAQGQSTLLGRWEAALPGPESITTITLRIDGTAITGGIMQPRGTSRVFDGRVESGTVWLKATSPDGQRTISLSGVVNGNEISFTRDLTIHPGGSPGTVGIFGALGPRAFTVTRAGF